MDFIRKLIDQERRRGRTHLSRRMWEIWDWRQANGLFRQIACRDLLRQLDGKGPFELPLMLRAPRNLGYKNRVDHPELFNPVVLHTSLNAVAS